MPGATLEDYEILGSLGSGTYGTCRKVRRKRDGKLMACKEMSYAHMSEQEKALMVSEVNLLRQLRHDNIVRYHERVVDKATRTLYIFMELCEGGDVASVIKQYAQKDKHIEEAFIWRVLHQLTLALHECHGRTRKEKSILHRDLKPANIFLDAKYNCKLGDFGLARVLSSEASFASTFVGTPYYMSPEQVSLDEYDESCDMWSLGCVLYELATLSPPFVGNTHRELGMAICGGKIKPMPKHYSSDLRSLISSLLSVDSELRPSAGDILENPLLKKYIKQLELDERSHSAMERLVEREEKVAKKEEALKQKERELEMREKEIQQKEIQLRLKEKLLSARRSHSDRQSPRPEKENCAPSSKEVNEMNNKLMCVLKRAAKTTMSKNKRDLFVERVGHLTSESQDWTKFDLVKTICREMERRLVKDNSKDTKQYLARLATILNRSTEIQREMLEIGSHKTNLLAVF